MGTIGAASAAEPHDAEWDAEQSDSSLWCGLRLRERARAAGGQAAGARAAGERGVARRVAGDSGRGCSGGGTAPPRRERSGRNARAQAVTLSQNGYGVFIPLV